MNVIKKHYVTFPVAVLLKNNGFNLPVNSAYTNSPITGVSDILFINSPRGNGRPIVYGILDLDWNFGTHQRGQNRISRPEQWMVVDWFRIHHRIHCRLETWIDEDGIVEGYDCLMFRNWTEKINYQSAILTSSSKSHLFSSPEEAYEDAFLNRLTTMK